MDVEKVSGEKSWREEKWAVLSLPFTHRINAGCTAMVVEIVNLPSWAMLTPCAFDVCQHRGSGYSFHCTQITIRRCHNNLGVVIPPVGTFHCPAWQSTTQVSKCSLPVVLISSYLFSARLTLLLFAFCCIKCSHI